jgi:hypothetical protein
VEYRSGKRTVAAIVKLKGQNDLLSGSQSPSFLFARYTVPRKNLCPYLGRFDFLVSDLEGNSATQLLLASGLQTST